MCNYSPRVFSHAVKSLSVCGSTTRCVFMKLCFMTVAEESFLIYFYFN